MNISCIFSRLNWLTFLKTWHFRWILENTFGSKIRTDVSQPV